MPTRLNINDITAFINAQIYANGVKYITGPILNSVLNKLKASTSDIALFDENTNYFVGEARVYDGQWYLCIEDTTAEVAFNPEQWDKLTSTDFIPLTGTADDTGLSGNIKITDESNLSIYQQQVIEGTTFYSGIKFAADGDVRFYALDKDNPEYSTYLSLAGFQMTTGGKLGVFKGNRYDQDYSAQFDDLSIPHRLYNDDRYVSQTYAADTFMPYSGGEFTDNVQFADGKYIYATDVDNTRLSLRPDVAGGAMETRYEDLENAYNTKLRIGAAATISSTVPNFAGFKYGADYFANYTTRSLIDYGNTEARYLKITVAADTYAALAGAEFTGDVILNSDAYTSMMPVTYQQLVEAVNGVFDLQGGYDPTITGDYPVAADTDPLVATIPKGFVWYMTAPGMVGDVPVDAGDTVTSLVNDPGQTDANWLVKEHNFGYTPVSNVLNSAYFFVGNGSNVAAGVAMSGDASLSNAGVVTVSKIGGKNVTLAGALTTVGAYGITFQVAAATSLILPATGTVAVLENKLSDFSETTSDELRSVIADPTGDGAAVFANGPELVDPIVGTQAAGNNTEKAASTEFVQTALVDYDFAMVNVFRSTYNY